MKIKDRIKVTSVVKNLTLYGYIEEIRDEGLTTERYIVVIDKVSNEDYAFFKSQVMMLNSEYVEEDV